jgi:hypothetical protein
VLAVDGREFTAIKGQEFCPKEIPLSAQEDKVMEERLQRVGVIFSGISHGFEVGSKVSKQPDERHVAMGFPLKSSAGSNPVEVSYRCRA